MLLIMALSIIFLMFVHNIFDEKYYDRSLYWEIVRKFRFTMFFEIFLLLMLVSVIHSAAQAILPPFFFMGWGNLLGIESNIIALPALAGQSSPDPITKIAAMLFILFVLWASPFIAMYEEEMFRDELFGCSEILWGNLKFGLLHMIMGIGLVSALLVGVLGLFFSWKYLKSQNAQGHYLEALKEAAAYHSMSHHIIFGVLLLVIVLSF